MRGTEAEFGQSKFCFHEDLSIFKMAAKMATPKSEKIIYIVAYKWQRIILSSATEDLPKCSDEKLTWLCNIER